MDIFAGNYNWHNQRDLFRRKFDETDAPLHIMLACGNDFLQILVGRADRCELIFVCQLFLTVPSSSTSDSIFTDWATVFKEFMGIVLSSEKSFEVSVRDSQTRQFIDSYWEGPIHVMDGWLQELLQKMTESQPTYRSWANYYMLGAVQRNCHTEEDAIIRFGIPLSQLMRLNSLGLNLHMLDRTMPRIVGEYQYLQTVLSHFGISRNLPKQESSSEIVQGEVAVAPVSPVLPLSQIPVHRFYSWKYWGLGLGILGMGVVLGWIYLRGGSLGKSVEYPSNQGTGLASRYNPLPSLDSKPSPVSVPALPPGRGLTWARPALWQGTYWKPIGRCFTFG